MFDVSGLFNLATSENRLNCRVFGCFIERKNNVYFTIVAEKKRALKISTVNDELSES